MVLRLPYSQSCHVSVEANPFVFWVGVLDLARFEQRRSEVDLEHVTRALLQLAGDVQSVRNEHVVAFQDDFTIEFDSRERIKSIERKDMDLTILRSRRRRELDSVSPGLLANPFAFELVEAQEWIGNSGATQVSQIFRTFYLE